MENKRRNEEKQELMRSPQPRSNVWKRRLNLKVNLLLPWFIMKDHSVCNHSFYIVYLFVYISQFVGSKKINILGSSWHSNMFDKFNNE